MNITNRHIYLVIFAVIAFLTAVDGGLLTGWIPLDSTLRWIPVLLNVGLGIACSILPSWLNPDAPIPPLPVPPVVKAALGIAPSPPVAANPSPASVAREGTPTPPAPTNS